MRLPGWRALGLFWLIVLACGGGTLLGLGLLGPPPRPAPDAPLAAPSEPAAAPIAPQAPPPATSPAAAAPASTGLPAAPEPPPLGDQPAPRAGAAPVIAAPDPALLEATRHGPVPRLGPESRSSIRTYARAFDRSDPRPRIGLVVSNIGASLSASEDAIRRLPGGVTLAFSPYAARPEPLLERARARGMEVLVALPLESQPRGGMLSDSGERGMLTTLPPGENQDRLLWALARIQGQVGAIGGLGVLRGERFAANAALLGAVQQELTARGLLYVDPRPGAPPPAQAIGRSVDLLLDEPSAVPSEVERQLAALEALARQNRSALGLASNPSSSVISAIVAWAEGAEARGVVIAPITALARRPPDPPSR